VTATVTISLSYQDQTDEDFASALTAKLAQLCAEGWSVQVVSCRAREAVIVARSAEPEVDAEPPAEGAGEALLVDVRRVVESLPPGNAAAAAAEAVRRVARWHHAAVVESALESARVERDHLESLGLDRFELALPCAVASALEVTLRDRRA
jgi:hypothetical protein